MLVRLAIAWIDPHGVIHGAGEHVDIDAITLAELEEQGVVEIMTDPTTDWNGPSGDPKTKGDPETDWNGPSSTEPTSQTADWNGPSGEPDDGK